jgi:hypothetical protein
MSLGHGYDMVLLLPRHSTDMDTSSPSPGERCAGTVALIRHDPPGDSELGATTVTVLWRTMGFPDPAPLSRMPTWNSSLRICVG